ncbi:MAG: aminopeptidase P family protein [Desulfobacterales bacterium]|nr:aminopeptidase P family protein [Desulfobacterales bacterium]MDX2512354.1 aminopeptidase P family protein [Desulfobacterales bacterium]
MNEQETLRIEKVRASINKQDIDTLLVSTQENRRYLSAFTGEDTQCDESAGSLFITGNELILATDSRFDLQAAKESEKFEIICYREGLAKALPDILRQLGSKRLGLESTRMSLKQFHAFEKIISSDNMGTELVPTENIVEQIREIKDEEEIEKTRQALLLAEKAFVRVLREIQPGMTEKKIAWLLEKKMRESGAEALSFPSIVASGPTSALPHAIPGDRTWTKGEPLLFDWGARLNGYCSDTSRTLVLGEADSTFQKVFQTVVDAQKKSIDAIRDGASTREVDRIARDHIENKGFKGKFGHGLGHGTGLAIHEAPRLSPLRDTVLKAGMLVTVEPGIYLPEWGGVRIENQVVVRDKSAEVLNTLDEDISFTNI